MSWGSQFFASLFNGLTGGPAVVAPSHPDQVPLINALNTLNQTGTQMGEVLAGTAETAVNDYLTTKVGPVGAAVADIALQALIATAASKLSPAAVATNAHSTAAAVGAANAGSTS